MTMAPERKAPLSSPGTTVGDELKFLASKVNDHSTVLQAVQGDLHHIVRAVDKLTAVAERQTELSVKQAAHGDSIDRAFKTIEGTDSKLVGAIRELADAFKEDRKQSAHRDEIINGFRGSIAALKWVIALTLPLGVLLVSFTYSRLLEIDREKIAATVVHQGLEARIQEIREGQTKQLR